MLVPLSHAMVTFQFLNRGTAGTIRRSYWEFAGNANARLKLSAVYVHCDDTPLRSVMCATKPPTTVSNDTVGPSFGAGGGGLLGGGGVVPFEHPATITFAPVWFCSLSKALLEAAATVAPDAPTSSP